MLDTADLLKLARGSIIKKTIARCMSIKSSTCHACVYLFIVQIVPEISTVQFQVAQFFSLAPSNVTRIIRPFCCCCSLLLPSSVFSFVTTPHLGAGLKRTPFRWKWRLRSRQRAGTRKPAARSRGWVGSQRLSTC